MKADGGNDNIYRIAQQLTPPPSPQKKRTIMKPTRIYNKWLDQMNEGYKSAKFKILALLSDFQVIFGLLSEQIYVIDIIDSKSKRKTEGEIK